MALIALRKTFENELKNKLANKTTGNQMEENVLFKAFRFFDNSGTNSCNKEIFMKTIIKVGLTGFSEHNLNLLYEIYSKECGEPLNYKDFIGILYQNESVMEHPQRLANLSNPESPTSYRVHKEKEIKGGQSIQKNEKKNYNSPQTILEILRMNIKENGIVSLIILETVFRNNDENCEQIIDNNGFIQSLKNYGIPTKQLQILFDYFDKENSGKIDYDEFIRAIRGEMNETRRNVIEKIFNSFKPNDKGFVSVNFIINNFNPNCHPDVVNGTKKALSIYEEFVETFQGNHVYLNGEENPSENVDVDEFLDYYDSYSMFIEDDDLFINIVQNLWSGRPRKVSKCKRHSKEKCKMPENEAKITNNYNSNNIINNPSNNNPAENNDLSNNKVDLSQSPLNYLKKFIIENGYKYLINLANQFKIFDKNNKKTLEYTDFTKAMLNTKINIQEDILKNIFEEYCNSNIGLLNYEEFFQNLLSELNERRRNVVLAAFNKIDSDKSGIVNFNDIKFYFTAKGNPKVKSGEISEGELYSTFMETFDIHHNFYRGIRDKRITLDEFIDYYKYVSLSIPTDEFFEEVLRTSWKLDNSSFSNLSNEKEKNKKENNKEIIQSSLAKSNEKNSPSKDMPNANCNEGSSKESTDYLSTLTNTLKNRGIRGIMSMRRAFMLYDDTNKHMLSFDNFIKYLERFVYNINKVQAEKIFTKFLVNKEKEIDYYKLINEIVGEMNQFRKQLITKVFNSIDKNKTGVIKMNDIRNNFRPKGHPEVKNGSKNEQEIFSEFLDNLDYHFILLCQERNADDEDVSLKEFLDFYRYISFTINDDKYFERIINGEWGL